MQKNCILKTIRISKIKKTQLFAIAFFCLTACTLPSSSLPPQAANHQIDAIEITAASTEYAKDEDFIALQPLLQKKLSDSVDHNGTLPKAKLAVVVSDAKVDAKSAEHLAGDILLFGARFYIKTQVTLLDVATNRQIATFPFITVLNASQITAGGPTIFKAEHYDSKAAYLLRYKNLASYYADDLTSQLYTK